MENQEEMFNCLKILERYEKKELPFEEAKRVVEKGITYGDLKRFGINYHWLPKGRIKDARVLKLLWDEDSVELVKNHAPLEEYLKKDKLPTVWYILGVYGIDPSFIKEIAKIYGGEDGIIEDNDVLNITYDIGFESTSKPTFFQKFFQKHPTLAKIVKIGRTVLIPPGIVAASVAGNVILSDGNVTLDDLFYIQSYGRGKIDGEVKDINMYGNFSGEGVYKNIGGDVNAIFNGTAFELIIKNGSKVYGDFNGTIYFANGNVSFDGLYNGTLNEDAIFRGIFENTKINGSIEIDKFNGSINGRIALKGRGNMTGETTYKELTPIPGLYVGAGLMGLLWGVGKYRKKKERVLREWRKKYSQYLKKVSEKSQKVEEGPKEEEAREEVPKESQVREIEVSGDNIPVEVVQKDEA